MAQRDLGGLNGRGLPPSRVKPASWKLAVFTFFALAIGTATLHAVAWAVRLAGRSLRLRIGPA